MTYRLVIYNEAHDDIFRNADWWAINHSLEQAIVWQDAIYSQLEALKEMPERRPLAAENPYFSFDVREALIGLGSRPRYRAIFTIQNDAVHVLTVLDAAQDQLQPGDLEVRGD
jgi:plasmid stabilization system protein ParE